MRLFEFVLPSDGLTFDLSGEEWAGVHVEVDDGTCTLTVEIDGYRQSVDIPAGRSWSSGTNLRQGIGQVKLAGTCTVTFDIGPDAGTPGIGADIGITTVKKGALTGNGVAITTGATAEELLATNTARRYLLIVNRDAAETMFVGIGVTAVDDETSIELAAGQSYVMEGSFISTDAISILAATSGHKVACYEG